jgi:hypothetical protein
VAPAIGVKEVELCDDVGSFSPERAQVPAGQWDVKIPALDTPVTRQQAATGRSVKMYVILLHSSRTQPLHIGQIGYYHETITSNYRAEAQ